MEATHLKDIRLQEKHFRQYERLTIKLY